MADFEFPQINPEGPIPAPNTKARGDRPALRAGRELSAYGDKDYPEACKTRQHRETAQALGEDASRMGSAAYGNMRQQSIAKAESQPTDSAQFESFDADI